MNSNSQERGGAQPDPFQTLPGLYLGTRGHMHTRWIPTTAYGIPNHTRTFVDKVRKPLWVLYTGYKVTGIGKGEEQVKNSFYHTLFWVLKYSNQGVYVKPDF